MKGMDSSESSEEEETEKSALDLQDQDIESTLENESLGEKPEFKTKKSKSVKKSYVGKLANMSEWQKIKYHSNVAIRKTVSISSNKLIHFYIDHLFHFPFNHNASQLRSL